MANKIRDQKIRLIWIMISSTMPGYEEYNATHNIQLQQSQ